MYSRALPDETEPPSPSATALLLQVDCPLPVQTIVVLVVLFAALSFLLLGAFLLVSRRSHWLEETLGSRSQIFALAYTLSPSPHSCDVHNDKPVVYATTIARGRDLESIQEQCEEASGSPQPSSQAQSQSK